jgi:hypothetical protein
MQPERAGEPSFSPYQARNEQVHILGSVRRLLDHGVIAHDQHIIGDFGQLLQVARRPYDAGTGTANLAHTRNNVRPGSNIDTARGLIEHEYGRSSG